MVASEVTAQAAVLLNDASQGFWTNTVLIPCLTKANEELEMELEINQVPLLKQKSSPVTSVEIGDTQLDEYPTDFVEPIALYERVLSSSDDWVEVEEVEWVDPNNLTSSEIVEWAFRDNKIYINPPQTDREIYLDYVRKLTPLTATNSVVEIIQSKIWLAVRTAQIAALNIGHNKSKADSLQPEADIALDRLVRRLINNAQGVSGSRRQGFKGSARRR